MKQWYLFYTQGGGEILHQAGAELKTNLYGHQGKIVNNFTDHLPALQSKLVQEVLKENYDFGFAIVEQVI